MALPHHTSILHHGDTFQPSVWVRRHDPSGDPRLLATFPRVRGRRVHEERRVNLDLIDEAREEAKIKAEAVKRRVERQYSCKVKLRQFQVGDLVMRKAHPYELENKLSSKWTGPFRVTKAKANGSYKLETLEGGPIPRSWNAANLKFYFS